MPETEEGASRLRLRVIHFVWSSAIADVDTLRTGRQIWDSQLPLSVFQVRTAAFPAADRQEPAEAV